ncbi:hypothetical protein JTE90_002032 [Oedothorax gibbosus]|uniref:Uncharacterized protein n=1 Tax=Oedothorax gibbosus TaxID=931172 RepID=A0AAV6UR91_9ARAC|nr:hypothetical protein JTE90_002032 [Oedothorax gibbosus]
MHHINILHHPFSYLTQFLVADPMYHAPPTQVLNTLNELTPRGRCEVHVKTTCEIADRWIGAVLCGEMIGYQQYPPQHSTLHNTKHLNHLSFSLNPSLPPEQEIRKMRSPHPRDQQHPHLLFGECKQRVERASYRATNGWINTEAHMRRSDSF